MCKLITILYSFRSLGCTVIELLTGHPPYWEHDQMHAVFLMVKVGIVTHDINI